MSDATPPRRLPTEYLEIWEALSRADGQAASRQQLAGRLGLSTYTLQRILVDGNVPRFKRGQRTRVLHAWVRILSRLAWSLGVQPQRWIELVGIPWDTGIEEVSLSAVSALRSRHTTRPSPGAGMSTTISMERPIRRIGIFNADGPTEIGIEGRPPFDRHIPTVGRPFLEEFARRILLQLDPEADLRFRDLGEETEPAKNRGTDPGTPRFACGILDRDIRQGERARWLHLPLFRVPLSALCLARIGAKGPSLSWDSIGNGVAARDSLFAVRRRSNAHRFLAGSCGIPRDRILPLPEGRPEFLAQVLLRESSARADRVLLVDDSLSIRRIRQTLDQSGETGIHWTVMRSMGDPARRPPRYPLLLAGAGLSGGAMRLLREARDAGMLGRGATSTARLFSEAFVWMIRDGITPMWIGIGGTDGGRHFREAFLARSIELLTRFYEEDHGSKLSFRAGATPLVSPSVRARETIRDYLSEPWLPILEQISPAQVGDRVSPFCRSCSASLQDAHNQGASDRYCRFCSDESGRLRPRDEVLALLTDWMVWWQGDITKDEALGRAELYMRALPAWRDN